MNPNNANDLPFFDSFGAFNVDAPGGYVFINGDSGGSGNGVNMYGGLLSHGNIDFKTQFMTPVVFSMRSTGFHVDGVKFLATTAQTVNSLTGSEDLAGVISALNGLISALHTHGLISGI